MKVFHAIALMGGMVAGMGFSAAEAHDSHCRSVEKIRKGPHGYVEKVYVNDCDHPGKGWKKAAKHRHGHDRHYADKHHKRHHNYKHDYDHNHKHCLRGGYDRYDRSHHSHSTTIIPGKFVFSASISSGGYGASDLIYHRRY